MAENNIRLIDRTMLVLSFLTRRPSGASVSEIASAVGLAQPTVYRILTTLCDHKVVTRVAKGNYQIGPLVLAWAQAYNRKTGIAGVADLLVERLWQDTGETVNLFYLENWHLCFLKRLQSPQPISTNCHVGGMLDLYSSSAGRAILSVLPDKDVDAYLDATPLVALTERTPVDRGRIWDKVFEARRTGYGEENEENERGVRCIGAAILDASGTPVGAVSITAPAFRLGDERVPILGGMVAKTARSISREMGWPGADPD